MNQFSEFYIELMRSETAKKKIFEILDGKALDEAEEEQLIKIGAVAQSLGYQFSLEEAKAYFNTEEKALDDEELDAVAGGKGPKIYVKYDDMQHNTHIDYTKVN